MSRLKESVLSTGTAYAGHNNTMDLANGGQNGHLARIGRVDADGKYYDEWISNQAYIRRNVIPVVLAYPEFMTYMPDSQKWIDAYKALIELHPLTIDGLSSGLTVETDEHAIGGAGEMQEEITNVVRARSSLAFTFKEKAGKSIQKYLDAVIRYGYMDPDTKKPLVIKHFLPAQSEIGIYTPNFYTGTVIFIEPDITHRSVVDAWLCTNMFFKSNGDRTGKRDIHSAGEMVELSIESTSITLNNEAVLTLADSILKKLTVLNKIPDVDLILPINEADPRLATTPGVGFNERVETSAGKAAGTMDNTIGQ